LVAIFSLTFINYQINHQWLPACDPISRPCFRAKHWPFYMQFYGNHWLC